MNSLGMLNRIFEILFRGFLYGSSKETRWRIDSCSDFQRIAGSVHFLSRRVNWSCPSLAWFYLPEQSIGNMIFHQDWDAS